MVELPVWQEQGGSRFPGGVAMPVGDTKPLTSAFNISPTLTQHCPCRSFGRRYKVIISSKCFCQGFNSSDTFLSILP